MKKSIDIIFKILILAFPFFLLNYIYLNSSVWEDKYGLKKFKSVPDNIEIGNLGSSHGMLSFDYSVEGFNDKTCFNFSLLGQTLDFDSSILEQYINKFKQDSTLIICVSSFETDGIHDYVYQPEAKLRYYGFLTRNYLGDDYSFKEWFCFNYLDLFTSKDGLSSLKTVFANDVELLKSRFKMKNPTNHILPVKSQLRTYDNYTVEEKAEKAIKLVEHWKQLVPPSPGGERININYLKKIINLCEDHEVHTVVVTTPISREAFQILDENKTYYGIKEFYEDLQSEFSNTKFLNYIDLFFNRNTYFIDNNHLSPEGAREFSKTIYSDLVKFGYIKQE